MAMTLLEKILAAAWHKGKVWFKIPPSVRINFEGKIPDDVR